LTAGRRSALCAALVVVAAACFAPVMAAQAAESVKTVRVGDMTVRYRESGPQAGPPVVLLHGGGLTSEMWRPLASAAADAGFRVYSMETRNHGGTDNPGGLFGYELLASDLEGFVGALDIRKPMVVGYSDGAIIAQAWLLGHPGRARAAVLGGATHRIAADAHYMAGLRVFYDHDRRGALPDRALDALVVSRPEFAARLKALHATPEEPERWRRLHQLAWPTWTTRRVTPLRAYRAVDVPALVVMGESDEFFLVRDAADLADALPRGELAIIPGTGHSAFRDKAAIFNMMVIDFLKRSSQ